MSYVEDFDVALSFAGEDRTRAQALADALCRYGVKVFYDKYEPATLWGKDLYAYLSDLYQNRARYCVILLSQHYATKLWTNHERQSAQARAFRQHEEYILPVRLDETEIPGILATIGYLRWPPENPETIAGAVMAKLNKVPNPPVLLPSLRGNLSHVDGHDENDILNMLEDWIRKQPSRLKRSIDFSDVDRGLDLKDGTAKKYLEVSVRKWGYVVERKGNQTIVFKRRYSSPTNV